MKPHPAPSDYRIDLFKSAWNVSHCLSCGRDPRVLYDANNQYVAGWDETRRIEHKGQLCAECQALKDNWALRKSMERRK